jgi:hypothetical protein
MPNFIFAGASRYGQASYSINGSTGQVVTLGDTYSNFSRLNPVVATVFLSGATNMIYLGSPQAALNLQDSGFTGGIQAAYDPVSSLYVPGPVTRIVTGVAGGNNTLIGTGGGNTNYNGGNGGNNTLNFSTNAVTYDPCWDESGTNFSLILDLATATYSYQQLIHGSPAVYGGTVSNIQRVVGTDDCNDLISGNSSTLSLTGGGGTANIIYGAGGFTGNVATALYASNRTTTSNGGDGNNWVVFQSPTNSPNSLIAGNINLSNAYSYSGVNASLGADTYYFSNGVVQATGIMAGFANILGSTGNNTLYGDANNNILAGSSGNDTISGVGGNDTLYGGGGVNRVTGGASGSSRDVFVVGYDYNPVAAHVYTTYGTPIPTVPAPTTVSGNFDGIYAGQTLNTSGPTLTRPIMSASATTGLDNVMDWQSGDSLYVSHQGTAVINSLSTNQVPSGTIDLSSNLVYNNGQVIIPAWANFFPAASPAPTNPTTTYDAAPGVNQVYTHAGLNYINLNQSANALVAANNVDTVFVNDYRAREFITGFVHGKDKIYLSQAMLQGFGINNLNLTQSLNVSASASSGQQFSTGGVLVDAEYSAVYNAVLGSTVTIPTTDVQSVSNGAWNNSDHNLADLSGKVAVYATSAYIIGAGVSMMFNIFTIPVGVAMIVTGSLMAYQQSRTVNHQNPVLNGDMNGIANNLTASYNPGALGSAWASTPLMDLYQNFNDNYAKSLEVGGVAAGTAVHSIALVYSGSDTFIYLVSSSDNLIQNNEAYLLAEVRGQHVTTSDLTLWNGTSTTDPLNASGNSPTTSPYANASAAPTFPPNVVAVTFATDPGHQVVGILTNSSQPIINVTLDTPLLSSDTLTVTYGGITYASLTGSGQAAGTVIHLTPTSATLPDGSYALTVTSLDTNSGFSSTGSVGLVVQSVAPTNTTAATNLTFTTSASGINVNYSTTGSFEFFAGSTGVIMDTSGAAHYTTGTPTTTVGFTPFGSGNIATVTSIAQVSSITWIDQIHLQDILGNTTSIPLGAQPQVGSDPIVVLPYIGLGTTGNDAFGTVSYATPVAVYGFGGNDTITGGAGLLTFYGGAPGVTGVDTIVTGSGGGNITGAVGADTINLNASAAAADTINIADGASTRAAMQVVTGFNMYAGTNGAASDRLNFTSAGVQVDTLTVGGTVHAGDVLSVSINGSGTASYTVVAGDTAASAAAGLASAMGSYLGGASVSYAVSYPATSAVITVTAGAQNSATTVSAAVTGSSHTTTLTDAVTSTGLHNVTAPPVPVSFTSYNAGGSPTGGTVVFSVSNGVISFVSGAPVVSAFNDVYWALNSLTSSAHDLVAAYSDGTNTYVFDTGHAGTMSVVELAGVHTVTALGGSAAVGTLLV